jgi:two-component system, LytTR family, response regulator
VDVHPYEEAQGFQVPLDRVESLSRLLRIHRSVIVNIDSIVQLEPLSHGEFELLLKDGSHARVSRTYRSVLENRLGQKL